MKTIYILSNEYGIQKATRSLDESTLWEVQGGNSIEVSLSDYTELSSVVEDDTVLIQNEDLETLATLTVETYVDQHEHLLHDCSASHYTPFYAVGRVHTEGRLLEKLNLTKDLATCITSNCEKIAETQTEKEK